MKKSKLLSVVILAVCFVLSLAVFVACDNGSQTSVSESLSGQSASSGEQSVTSGSQSQEDSQIDNNSGKSEDSQSTSQSEDYSSSSEPIHVHNYQFVEFVWTEYTAQVKYVCANDNSHVEYYDAVVTSEVTTPATCTQTGVKTYTATYDGHTDAKEQVVAALDHDLVHHEAKGATCTEIGWNAYDTCSRCDYTTYEEIAALDHNYQFVEFVWTEYTAQVKYVCANDNSHVVYYDAVVTSEITTPATCTQTGVKTYTATYDGHTSTKEVTLESTEHNYVDGICSVCGEIDEQATPLDYYPLQDGTWIVGAGKTLYLEKIVIPKQHDGKAVTQIKDEGFRNAYNLQTIVIPDSVTSIGNYAFSGCSSLTSVYYDGGIAGWCNISFGGNTSNPLCYAHNLYIKDNGVYTLVTDLVIPDGVTNIGNYAFRGCSSLTSVTIGNTVTSIGNYAFRNCSSLTSITIPDGVTSIGDLAFGGCSKLTGLYYKCSAEDWGNISIASNYLQSTNADIYVYSETEPSFEGEYWHYDLDGNISVWSTKEYTKGLKYSLNSEGTEYSVTGIGTATGSNVIIPSRYMYKPVTSIGNYAFQNCSGLTSVTIPDSVKSIGSYSFYNCNGLTSVTIGNGVTSIGASAFEYCSSLTSVTIGNGVTSIGDYAFYGCDSLTSVTFKNTSRWYVSRFSTATSGTSINVTNATQNATYLKKSYSFYYWKRS